LAAASDFMPARYPGGFLALGPDLFYQSIGGIVFKAGAPVFGID
jgi:hypothetical protein